MPDPMDLTPSIYRELEQRARAILGRRRLGDQPETLSLVNQACLKIIKGKPRKFATRAEFLAFSAKTMRHVLIDLARGRNAEIRGGGLKDIPLDAAGDPAEKSAGSPEAEILDVHDKLGRMARSDPKLAQLVELKFFGGCTFQEIADVLGCSRDGAEAEWQFAKAWLRGALSDD